VRRAPRCPPPPRRGTREIERLRGYVRAERQAALLYRRLAGTAEGEDRATLLRLARGEEAHAAHWEAVLVRLGGPGALDEAADVRLRPGARLAVRLAGRVGLVGAMPLLERHEGREIAAYTAEPHATDQLVADEHDHTAMVRSLAPGWRSRLAGGLRAGVFGVNDGVVSNLALVLGVVASGAAERTVLTAGVAGLVAGALSMAVGEYVSVAGQQEVLRAGGAVEDAEDAAPWTAATASFATFALGAVVPLAPFAVADGAAAAVGALLLAGLLLVAVGGAASAG
jgi:vacuolar iron transporter family protein